MPQAEVLVGRVGKGEGEEKKASSRCQQETGPEGDGMLGGAAGVSSHQMNHRLFQVACVLGTEFSLENDHRALKRFRKHGALELPAGCCQHRHTASHQWSPLSFSGK